TAAVGGGGAIAAGGLVVGTKTIAAKALAALAVVAGTGGGGFVAVNEITHDSRPAAPSRDRPSAAASQTPARSSAPVAGTIPAVGIRSGTASERARERARLGNKNKKTTGRERGEGPRNGRDGTPGRGDGRPVAKTKPNTPSRPGQGVSATKRQSPKKSGAAKDTPAPKTGGASGTSADGPGPVVEPRQRRPDDVGLPAVTGSG
ncbi:MAG: hypothetical protein ACRDLS_01855, partial [Solirubrobacteraceae bacterium]